MIVPKVLFLDRQQAVILHILNIYTKKMKTVGQFVAKFWIKSNFIILKMDICAVSKNSLHPTENVIGSTSLESICQVEIGILKQNKLIIYDVNTDWAKTLLNSFQPYMDVQ